MLYTDFKSFLQNKEWTTAIFINMNESEKYERRKQASK